MNLTRDRAESFAWALAIAIGLAVLLALTFRVNALKSEVKLTERRIMAVRADTLALETEFQTRANQQQLAAVNDLEFGFKAPTASQYLSGERRLATLGKPAGPNAPRPILMASADAPAPAAGALPAVLAPIASKALGETRATRMLSDTHEAASDGDAVRPTGARTAARPTPAAKRAERSALALALADRLDPARVHPRAKKVALSAQADEE